MANKDALSSTFSHCGPTPSKDGDGGTFGHHKNPSVSKPADVGNGDVRKKFYSDVSGTPAKVETTMTGTAALNKK